MSLKSDISYKHAIQICKQVAKECQWEAKHCEDDETREGLNSNAGGALLCAERLRDLQKRMAEKRGPGHGELKVHV